MKIILCAVQVPFVKGGAEYHFDCLYKELQKRNHDVDYVKIPFKWYPPEEIINHALIWRLTDLSESNGEKIDGVIAQKFPSYLIKHKKKVIWLDHQHRQAYDLAYSAYDDLVTYGQIGEIVKKKIHKMDQIALNEAMKIFTISDNVSNRLFQYNHIHGETLIIPPPHLGRYKSGTYGDYIFYPGRLDSLKRQDLVIKAIKNVNSELRLVLSGNGPLLDEYIKIADNYGVRDRVDFLGYVSDEKMLNLYSNAFCIIYTPVDEDFGFVPIEAFFSKKPVITCNDSGGAKEFVESGKSGYITFPSPEEIAKKINLLYINKSSRTMGEFGYNKIIKIDFSWDNIIKKLIEPLL